MLTFELGYSNELYLRFHIEKKKKVALYPVAHIYMIHRLEII